MKHGLQLAGITLLWLVGLNIVLDYLSRNGLWAHVADGNFRRFSLQRRHNERDDVSNHQPHDCLLNRIFRRRSKKTSKLRVNGLNAGNSPVTGEFPGQRASNAENVSIWLRHHVGWHHRQRSFSILLQSCARGLWRSCTFPVSHPDVDLFTIALYIYTDLDLVKSLDLAICPEYAIKRNIAPTLTSTAWCKIGSQSGVNNGNPRPLFCVLAVISFSANVLLTLDISRSYMIQ